MKEFLSLLTLSDLFFLLFSFIFISSLLRFYLLQKEKELQNRLKKSLKEKLGMVNLGLNKSKIIHEFNNLLAVALLNLEFLAKEKRKSKRGETFLKEALKALKRLQEIVTAYQEQSDSGKNKSYFSPREEIEKALIFLKSRIKKLNIQVEKIFAKKIEIWGNKIKFYQVVSNLLLNALEAYQLKGELFQGKQKSLFLKLTSEQENLVFLIKDQAGGISQKDLVKVFNPLFTTKRKGWGLGLCIVKEIVENDFAGGITVKSREGKGTAFEIVIPNLLSRAARIRPGDLSHPMRVR